MTTAWRKGGAPLPAVGDEGAARVHWARWREAAQRSADTEAGRFAAAAADDPGTAALMTAVFGNSPYLSRGLIADQPFARVLIEEGPDAACAEACAALDAGAETESTDDLMRRLRAAKRRAALAIALADIASVWPLETVTAALSRVAESALGAACRHLLRQRHAAGDLALPAPDEPERGSGLIVLGMGKLGARELNYSSDIDLIVLYDGDAAAGAGAPQALFNRLARNLVRIMGEQTAHGYVFRTDLRLRPDPASTPLALSVRAARTYYRTAGRNWERAAMIKARPVAGDIEAAETFLDELRPFVWRRRLDFAAVQDMQTIKRQIDAARGGGGIAVAGHNVKLGRGGIREIEFFVQAQQLLWGGRNPDLRPRGTLAALDALVAAGRLARGDADELRSAYEFHRRLEHRLQMVNDAQTHTLPADDAGVARIAAFFAFESAAAFSDTVLARLRTVERRYAALFARGSGADDADDADDLVFSGTGDDPATLAALADAGYEDPAHAAATVRTWLAGRYPATRDARARELISRLAPAFVRAFARAGEPDAALRRFDGLLARLPAGVRLMSLFAARPELLGLVAEIAGSAPRLADLLARRPDLLDGVLARDFADLEVPDDAGMDEDVAEAARRGLARLFYAREFGAAEMRAELAAASGEAQGIEGLMRAQRHWAGERTFQVGVHVLRGALSPVEAAGPLSDIADACLAALLPAVADAFAARHGRVRGGGAALVAFGDLGSREMTADSALDLMLVHDRPADAGDSDGEVPLAPDRYYAGLCRRLVGAIAAPTAEGALYALDMRPRPSGTAGPVACSLRAFAERHGAGAAAWERLALTRARVVCGDASVGERFDALKRAALARPCDEAALAADIAGLREEARRGRGTGAERRGGLLDVEALARFLQLRHAAEAPEILAGDTVSVFEAAGVHALLDADTARELAEAARLWRNLHGILRLTAGADALEENATRAFRDVVARSGGRVVAEALAQSIEETTTRAAAHYDRLLARAGG